MSAREARRILGRLATVAGVAYLDSFLWTRRMPRPIFAMLDEAGHVTTAALLLSAHFALRSTHPSRRFLATALASAVLIDLDHLPEELLHARFLTAGTHRPYGHTLLVVAVAQVAALLAASPNVKQTAQGVATGVLLHLVRDVGTGGAPLLWPASKVNAVAPHASYITLLIVAALVAAPHMPRPAPRSR